MTKENVYYTPEIEEFFVGFEYERRHELINHNKEWFSGEQIHIKSNLSYIESEITNNRIRVKHLSKECIEELGFTEYNGVYKKGNYCLDVLQKYNCIQYEGPEYPVMIFSYKIALDYNCIFQGTIKNKSELKKLLKQLNIN